MHIRSINIYISNIGPKSEREGIKRFWGGRQYENNATEVIFEISSEILDMFNTKEDLSFRIDFNCNGFGYDPSMPLTLNDQRQISRYIPYSMTSSGKDIEAILVIKSADTEIIFGDNMIYFDKVKRDSEAPDSNYVDLNSITHTVNRVYQETLNIANDVNDKYSEIESICNSANDIVEAVNEAEALVDDIELRLARGDFNGVGIADIFVENGYLSIRKTNELEANRIAYIQGDIGNDGIGIKDIRFSENTELIIILTNDTEINLGVVSDLVYTPHISEDKILSWTNNGGLKNPDPVDLNPHDEWSQTGNEIDSQYIWESMQ